MTGPLLLGVDVAAILLFLEMWESEHAALSTGWITWSSIISPESTGSMYAAWRRLEVFRSTICRRFVEGLQA